MFCMRRVAYMFITPGDEQQAVNLQRQTYIKEKEHVTRKAHQIVSRHRGIFISGTNTPYAELLSVRFEH
jgi:hypothetical protein